VISVSQVEEKGDPQMDIDTVRNALLWCTILNYALLILWFVLHLLPHRLLHRLWGRWFPLTSEQFDAFNFAGIALYKLGILLFNLVPWVALTIIR
jgi:hypothetical protein